jgi:phosphinothricin acetyltransferase
MIRRVRTKDAEDICKIYNYYVAKSIVTFEERPVGTREIARRIEDITKDFPWFVYEDNGKIVGYAYASHWKARSAYRFAVEATVYVAPDCTGRKIGFKVYKRLIQELRKLSFHTVMGGIALPNDASIVLHEKLGFEKVAHFKEVGQKFGKWIDVGYWELLL